MKKTLQKFRWNLLVLLLTILTFVGMWAVVVRKAPVYEEYVIENANGKEFSLPFSSITAFGISGDDWKEGHYLADTTIDLELVLEDSRGNTLYQEYFPALEVANYSIADYHGILKQPIAVDTALLEGPLTIYCRTSNPDYANMTIALYGEKASLGGWFLAVAVIATLALQVALGLLQSHFFTDPAAKTEEDGSAASFASSLSSSCDKKEGKTVPHTVPRHWRPGGALWFVVMILLLGLLYELVLPPYSVQDETGHLATAYLVSNKIMGTKEYAEDGTSKVCIPQTAIHRMNWAGSAQEIYRFWYDTMYTGHDDPAIASTRLADVGSNIPRYVYLIPALGISLARLLHRSYQVIVLSGRIANLLFSAIMLVLIMRLCPRLKWAIAAIAVLPSSIWLFSSYSYDAWNLLWLMLLVAFCIWCRDKKTPVTLWNLVIFALIAAITFPVKVIYFPLACCLLLIPKKKLALTPAKIVAIVAGCAGIVAVFMCTRLDEAIALATTPLVDVRSLEGVEGTVETFTLQWIFAHPLRTLQILFHAALHNGVGYVRTAFTGEWSGLRISNGFAAIIVLLFLILIFTVLPAGYVRRWDRAWSVILFLSNSLLILVSFLLTYSYIPNDGSLPELHGVQGRYFLPLFLLLPFWGGFRKIQTTKQQKKYLLFGLIVCNILCILVKVAGIALGKGLLVKVNMT